MTRCADPGVSHRSRRALLITVAAATVMVGTGWSTAGAAYAVPVGPVTAGDPAPAVAAIPNELTRDVAAGEKLKGLFRVTAGNCAAGPVTGSYFRMIQPGGTVASGPYMQNTGTACKDKTYTPLRPGRDGGLSTLAYQPQPDPPFDSSGGGLNDKIIQPEPFFGAKFAAATNPVDPQTGIAVPVPVVTNDGAGKLSGDLRAYAAAYQGQHFNQGAPKPDGSTPGATTLAGGTYNPATKAYSLQWASTIVGGPFDKFTGVWHLEGTFEPAAANPPVTAGSAGGTTSPSAAPTQRTAAAAAPTAQAAPTAAAAAPATGAQKVRGASSTVTRRSTPAAGEPATNIPSTGLRLPLSLPAALIGAGALLRLAGRRPARTRKERRS